jgi:hypothetical protein
LAWGLHILYVFTLGARQQKLRRQLDDLRAQVHDHED